MNISKLIAKIVLASFVFSPVMQGVVLAEGKTVVDTGIKAKIAAEMSKFFTNVFATVKGDFSSLQKQAIHCKDVLGSVKFTKEGAKEGALDMFARITPESTLGKLGVVAVAVTGGIVIYYLKTQGMPEPVKVVAGKVKNFVPSATKVAKGAAALGVLGLAAAGVYAYKTGNVKPLVNVAYPVVGAPALYLTGKTAGYAKNMIISGVMAISSRAKSATLKGATYLPVVGKFAADKLKKDGQNKIETILAKQETSVQDILDILVLFKETELIWDQYNYNAKKNNGQMYKENVTTVINKVQGSFPKDKVTDLVNDLFTYTKNRATTYSDIVALLNGKKASWTSYLNPLSLFRK